MTQILFAIIVLTSQMAHAAGAHGEGVPWGTVIAQAVNVSILFGLIFYFARKPVADFFKNRKQDFLSAAEKAQSARMAAEQQKKEVEVKLTQLQSGSEESISRARAEAADLRNQLIKEAQELSKKIRDEAESAARLEVERAQKQIREQLLAEAMTMARQQLKQQVDASQDQKLQRDFMDRIQAVQK